MFLYDLIDQSKNRSAAHGVVDQLEQEKQHLESFIIDITSEVLSPDLHESIENSLNSKKHLTVNRKNQITKKLLNSILSFGIILRKGNFSENNNVGELKNSIKSVIESWVPGSEVSVHEDSENVIKTDRKDLKLGTDRGVVLLTVVIDTRRTNMEPINYRLEVH